MVPVVDLIAVAKSATKKNKCGQRNTGALRKLLLALDLQFPPRTQKPIKKVELDFSNS